MNQKGFTLIELLVVVAIIGVLAAIAIPQFSSYRLRAFNASALSTLKNSITAQEAVFADQNTYISCTSPSDCESKLPGLVIQNSGGNYAINPMSHTAAADGNSYDALASHINGDKTYNFSSLTGNFTD